MMSATVSARSFVSGSVKVASVKNGSRTVMKAGNWLPGSETPSYLDSLPASYGFGEFAYLCLNGLALGWRGIPRIFLNPLPMDLVSIL